MVADLLHQFGEPGVVELAYLVALENMRSRFNSTLGLTTQGFSSGEACSLVQRQAAAHSVEFVRSENCIDRRDSASVDHECVDTDLRVSWPIAVVPDDEARIAVHQNRLDLEPGAQPVRECHQTVQEARYFDRADQRPAGRIHPATAVRGHD
jgi:hypothetical protein